MPLPHRILLITDRYPPHAGGVARSAQRLAAHLSAAALEVHVLVTRCMAAPGTLNSAREGDVWVHRLGAGRNVPEAGQLALQAIEWLHEHQRFDLLHGHYASTCGFLAVYAAKSLGAASYVSLRGNDLDRDMHDPTRFPQLLWTLQNADAIGGVSRALVQQAKHLTARDDIFYTPNSVDTEVFRPTRPNPELRAKLGLDSGPIIGFAGELRHKKGAHFLFDAFREVASRSDAQLLLVGEIRPDERRALEQFLEDEPHLAERVKLHPYLHSPAELAALYNLMDVAVCPSLWEGMPNFVLEAMSCARPVLASDAGGLADLMIHGQTGWMLSRHALHRLGEALREVLQLNVQERTVVGQQARARVLQEFSPQRERNELLGVYRALCIKQNHRRTSSPNS